MLPSSTNETSPRCRAPRQSARTVLAWPQQISYAGISPSLGLIAIASGPPREIVPLRMRGDPGFMPLQIADRWFERRRIDDDITLLWEPHVVPLLRCNIWHVRGRDRDLLIDTG